MNIYLEKDIELAQRIKDEAGKRKRSVSYIIREKLRQAFGLKNGNGD